ncbi:MAG: PD-(D/E)XK nuclease family protein [Bacteroides sp.]|nr:PD-(D/E)XK nuclease family protein [Bacteroides sp.]
MTSFLQLVAEDLYKKLGNDLSHTAIVFPNKRASLFFNEHLARQSQRPIWSPACLSISELLGQLSTLQKGDPIRLVCELYQVFTQATGSEETLDDFYFWGELLISDFDDVDKNCVDASRLFSNLNDLKSIMDNQDFLTPEQEEAIRQFFQNFSIEKRTQLKERFIHLWDKLGGIYEAYRERLRRLGIAYEGMMYRDVVEHTDCATLPHEHYVFVGFNVLNKVEITFFKQLQRAGKALFYWDYDLFYTRLPRQQKPPFTHEAGEFILRNLKEFPNQLSEECFDTLRRPKKVRFLSAPTENAQARYLPQWVKEMQRESPEGLVEKENAVVLCNESLLLPLLHAIPAEVQNVNITMGFPLAQTPVYSFINALVELQTIGYHADSGRYSHQSVIGLLHHPYMQRLSARAETLEEELKRNNRFYPYPSELKQDEALEHFFTPAPGAANLCRYLTESIRRAAALYHQEDAEKENGREDVFNQLYRESLFKAYTLVGRLQSLVEENALGSVTTDTFRRLLNRLLTAANIPFHGEPAIGMQIMGVLETRNLDFRNLLILSLNEGQLPKNEGESSFIPYNLRKAFGMTTIEHKNSVYAYYFYRLIQRAENITLAYNTSSDGLNRGEMSRFMLQYQIEAPHEIEKEYLEAGQAVQERRTSCIRKDKALVAKMCHLFDVEKHPKSLLSPSALNTYLDCRLKFYYRYIARLKAPDEVTAEIDSALFGTIFHQAAENTYRHLMQNGQDIREEDLKRLLKEEHLLQEFVDRAFKQHFFHIKENEKAEYNGTQLIHSRVILSYLRQLLRNDMIHAPFRMEGMEKRVSEVMEVKTPLGPLKLQVGGTIDRMDSQGDTLRIVDYKTGGSPKTPHHIAHLFTPGDDRPNYVFQTFLYASIMSRKQPQKVAPALLYIHRAANEAYSPVIEMGEPRQPKMPVTNFAFYEDEFRERLQQLLEELFDQEVPFDQTESAKACEYCDYRCLCKK